MSKLSTADLATICHGSSAQERTLADHVESLLLSDQDGDPNLLTPPLRIVATCVVENPAQGNRSKERYQLEVSVTPRCQRW